MKTDSPYQEKLNRVIKGLQQTDMDALLLNRVSNISYLTGVVNSCSWVFISREGKVVALVMDSDVETYHEESVIDDIRPFRMHDPINIFRKLVKEIGFPNQKLGLELGSPGLPQHTMAVLRHAFPENIQFVNGETIIEEIRVIKTEQEIESIKKAVEIAELGMQVAIKNIRTGVRESDIALEAEYAMRKAGGRITTMNYLASGKRSCIAHHTPTHKTIEEGDIVAIDIHGGYLGYCADLARTVVCGRVEQNISEGYNCLTKAQEKTIKACRKGTRLIDIKKIFYQELNKAKNLKFLTGPVIHGVGIMNFEMPFFTFPYDTKGKPEVLDTNMVVAISNIGLYSNDGWGLRLEDTIRVTDAEPEHLTHFSKDLVSCR